MKPEIIFLSQEDVIAAGGMDIKDTLESVELGFTLHGRKECVQPPKINLRKGPPGSPQAEQGLIMALPGYVGGNCDVVGIKWVRTSYGGKPAKIWFASLFCFDNS